MIFATVGTQLAFPRLMDALNRIAPKLDAPVEAQVGPDTGSYSNLFTHGHLEPSEFEALFIRARVVVAHAGMGTILSARALAKPLIVLPREAALGEHRNDHQLATAERVGHLPGIHVARTEDDLERLLTGAPLHGASAEAGPTLDSLVTRLRAEIFG